MSEYTEAVAVRAKTTASEVERVMAERGIREWLPTAAAPPLRVNRVAFSGFKDITEEPPTDDFTFEWDVPDGVSALASDGNSVGKTSVIEVIRWLLSGRSSVDNWVFARIREAELAFSIDGRSFSVEVQRDGAKLAGRLLLAGEEIRRFDEQSFESVMEELLLHGLGLERIGTFQRGPGSDRGKVAGAGWPFLIDALYVRPSELGTVIGGVGVQAGTLLQVYLALPWFDTLLQVRAALGEATQAQTDARNAKTAEAQVRSTATASLSTELAEARRKLREMADADEVFRRLRTAVDRGTELADLALAAGARVQSAAAEAAAAQDAHVAAQRALRNIVEREAAGRFFRALEPKACPRCATPIDAERREEEHDHGVCSVCDREAHYEPDPTASARAEEQVASTQDAVTSATQALADAEAELAGVITEQGTVETLVATLSADDALARRADQQAVVFRLEGRLAERADTERDIQEVTPTDVTQAVLDAAKAEADRRVGQTKELFAELNGEILDLGQKFGIAALTETKLDRGAHLPVVKQDTKYNYGQLPAGDKLRLKVAVVLALLRVGARRGAGHHPGLLFVDSPGAEEVSAGSLTQMMNELVTISAELGVQIVVGTARLDDVRTVLEPDRLRTPEAVGQTLW